MKHNKYKALAKIFILLLILLSVKTSFSQPILKLVNGNTVDFVATANPKEVLIENGVKKLYKNFSNERTITIQNVGNQPLLISNANSACTSCIKLLTKFPMPIIKSGETATISFQLTASIASHYQKSISIFSNDKNNTTIVAITADVSEKFMPRVHPILNKISEKNYKPNY